MTLETFSGAGEIHNAFLAHAYDKFIIDDSLTTKEEKIESLKGFQQAYLETFDLEARDKALISAGIEKYKNMYDNTEILCRRVFDAPTRSDGNYDEMNIFQAIDYAYEANVIDDFECEKLKSVANTAKVAMAGEMTQAELVRQIADIVRDWEAKGYLVEGEYGITLGNTLAVSMASMEYWDEHPDLPEFEPVVVASIVARDIAGGLVGAVSGGIGSAVRGGFSWGAVGWGAASGALVASTGIIGRIASWIKL